MKNRESIGIDGQILSIGVIMAIIICLLCVICCVMVYCWRKRRNMTEGIEQVNNKESIDDDGIESDEYDHEGSVNGMNNNRITLVNNVTLVDRG